MILYKSTDEDSELTDLTAMAEDAFVKPSFSIREHLMRLYEGESAKDLLASQRMLLSGDAGTGAKGMFDYRYDAYMDVRLHEFDMMRLDQKERRDHWEDQMRAILARGQMEWTDGEKRIKARYEDWLDNVGREYKNKKDAWGDRYLGFLEDKNVWLNVVTEQSTRIGDVSVLENFGDVTQSAIDNAGGDIIITTLAESIPDPNKILGEVVDLTLLDTLLANAASLTRGIKFFKPTIFTSLGSDKFTTAELMQNIKDFQGLQNEEYYTHVSKMEYEKMMDSLSLAEENFNSSVEGANDSMQSSLHKTMRGDGYVLSGNIYKRDLVVVSSIMDGMLYDEGFVDRYSYFNDYRTDFTSEVAVSDAELNNMNADALDTVLFEEMGLAENSNYDEDEEDPASEFIQEIEWTEKVVEKIGTEMVSETVTGEDGEDKIIERMVPIFETRYEQRSEERDVNVSPGKFGLHVGYAPGFEEEGIDFDKNWSKSVRFEGHGEMGTIMGQYIFNKMREGMGFAMVNRPYGHDYSYPSRGRSSRTGVRPCKRRRFYYGRC